MLKEKAPKSSKKEVKEMVKAITELLIEAHSPVTVKQQLLQSISNMESI